MGVGQRMKKEGGGEKRVDRQGREKMEAFGSF